MPRIGLVLFVFFLLGSFRAFPQSAPRSNNTTTQIITRTVIYKSDSLFLDSLSVVPQSLRIVVGQDTLKDNEFSYHYSSGYLVLADSLRETSEPLRLSYRVLPFAFHQAHHLRDYSMYDSMAVFQEIRYAERYAEENNSPETLINTPNLQKSGSLSRGITFGNRQDVFVNAALNLQLEGNLTDDLSIRAAITDQNVPLQPDGTTQQLQQFDNVFIEFKHRYATLTVGDVQLRHLGSSTSGVSRSNSLFAQSAQPYFLKYQRNVQGGLLNTRYSLGEKAVATSSVGAAIAKGKFASINLAIQEGVQGPYRLNSPENQRSSPSGGELMFFVLANSEKVYHNGQLLTRGFDQDYTIDYNLGEIIFTPRVVLTQFSRIVVDYEYADRSFSRSIVTANHRQTHQRISFSVNYYQEGDNARRPLAFELAAQDYQRLSEAGDNLLNQTVIAVDTVNQQDTGLAYGNQNADVPGVGNVYRVRYSQEDTVVAGTTYQMFKFGTGESARFLPQFTFVGEGRGNYVLSTSQVNGKVFEWVAPQNNLPQGSYEPVRQLPAPQRKRIVTVGSEISLSDKDQLYTEAAFSETDINTLSSVDSQDDRGKAVVVGYRSQPRRLTRSSAYRWSQQVQYEYVDQYFQAIDPFRSVEFERDWSNLPTQRLANKPVVDDHILQSQTQLIKDTYNRFQYRWVGRKQSNWLAGHQHSLETAKEIGGFRLSGTGFIMQSRFPQQQGSWKRVILDVHRPNRWVTPGYTYRREENEVRNTETDSIIYSAEHYEEHQWYLTKGDSIAGAFRLDYRIRNNRLPVLGEMRALERVQMIRASWDKALGEQHQLRVNTTYRSSQLQNEILWEGQSMLVAPANTIMGQLDWKGSLLKRSLQMSFTYAIANGREIKRDFVYVQVPTGEGMFTWRDSNKNGIEELDEFFEARYWDERNYVRVIVPSNEYVQAFSTQLNYRVKAQFPQQWSEANGLKSFLARFANVTHLRLNQKQTDSRLAARVLPNYQVAPEDLLSARESVWSTFFFNQQNPRFGVEGGIRSTRWKQLLQQGSEDRYTRVYRTQLRYQWNRKWKALFNAQQNHQQYQLEIPSTQTSARNFNITAYQVAPELHWQPHMNIRLVTKTSWTNKVNAQVLLDETGGEEATLRSVGWELQSRRVMKRNISASLEWLSIDYNADARQAVAYEMLEGLLPGSNARWSLNLQQKLIQGLQLTLNYQGRKSPDQVPVHSGSVSVRALF